MATRMKGSMIDMLIVRLVAYDLISEGTYLWTNPDWFLKCIYLHPVVPPSINMVGIPSVIYLHEDERKEEDTTSLKHLFTPLL